MLDPVYTGDDGDLKMVCRKLAKADCTTKLKGLAELRALAESKEAPVLRGVVPHFMHLYHRLSLNREHRVRESLQRTLGALIVAVPKAFMVRIRHLVGPWWVALSDPSKDVAAAAKEGLDDVDAYIETMRASLANLKLL